MSIAKRSICQPLNELIRKRMFCNYICFIFSTDCFCEEGV